MFTIYKKNGSNIFTFLLVAFPLIAVYASPIPGVALGEFFILIYFIFEVLRCIKVKYLPKANENNLVFLYVMSILISLCSALLLGDFSFVDFTIRILRWGLYIYILLRARFLINKSVAVKMYKLFSFIVSIALWYQLFMYYLFGIVSTLKIPWIPLSKSFGSVYLQCFEGVNIFRPYSFFAEPSHYSYYAIIGLCVVLFIDKEKNSFKDYLFAIFISLSLIASTSLSALVLLIIVWIYFIILILIKKRSCSFIILVCIIGMIILISVSFNNVMKYSTKSFPLNSAFNLTFNRLIDNPTNSVRISYASQYMSYLNDLESIIGVGIGNEEYYFLNQFGVEVGFLSGMGFINIEVGYIGLLITMLLFLRMLKNTTPDYRIFIILFIVSNIYEGTLFSIELVLFLMWPFFFDNTPSKNWVYKNHFSLKY